MSSPTQRLKRKIDRAGLTRVYEDGKLVCGGYLSEFAPVDILKSQPQVEVTIIAQENSNQELSTSQTPEYNP